MARRLQATTAVRNASRNRSRHLDELLDEALADTFPASDPPAMLEPAPDERSRRDQEE